MGLDIEQLSEVDRTLDQIEAQECAEWVRLNTDPEVLAAEIARLRRTLRLALPALALAEQRAYTRMMFSNGAKSETNDYLETTNAKHLVEAAIDGTP